MPTLTAPEKRHLVAAYETPAAMAAWASRAVRSIDATISNRTVGAVGQVARALVDNAQLHGQAPVTLEVAVSTFVSISVTDFGDGFPAAHEDGTGSLAVIVGELASLWDIAEHEDGSKTVTAMVPILEEPVQQARKRVSR